MGRPPAGGKAEELTRAAPAEDATRAHHRTDRLAARRRFDEVECTVSHLLRFPHPALRGRRYGEALLHGLADRGIEPGPDGVLEIGGGAGHVAEAAWRGDAGPFTGCRWTSLDLSPSLLHAQRRRLLAVGAEPADVPRGPHRRWSGLRADAMALPLRSRSLPGVVPGNEMLADLPTHGSVNVRAGQLVPEVG